MEEPLLSFESAEPDLPYVDESGCGRGMTAGRETSRADLYRAPFFDEERVFLNTLIFVLLLFVFPTVIVCVLFLLHDGILLISVGILVAFHTNFSIYNVDAMSLIISTLSGLVIGGCQLFLKHLNVSFYPHMLYPSTAVMYMLLSPLYHHLSKIGYLCHTTEGSLNDEKSLAREHSEVVGTFGSTISQLFAVNLIFGQLYTTLLLAPMIQSLLEIILFCSAYPFFISAFKISARTIANKSNPFLGERIEFQSIIFAALPFRFLFINIAGSWMFLGVVMTILLIYKSTKYTMLFLPKAKSCMISVVSFFYKKKNESKSLENSSNHIVHSFYYQVLFDIGSVPLTILVFLYARKLHDTIEIEAISDLSDRRFVQLLYQLASSFVVDCLFLATVLFKFYTLRDLLRKGYSAVLRNMFRFCIHSVFLVVIVVYLLSR